MNKPLRPIIYENNIDRKRRIAELEAQLANADAAHENELRALDEKLAAALKENERLKAENASLRAAMVDN